MMRVFFGTLGLVALGVAAVVGIFAAFGPLGSKAPQEKPFLAGLEAVGESTMQEVRQTAAAIDEPVTAGDLEWTVTNASLEHEVHSFTFPPEHVPGRYVTLEFTVENTSDRPVTLTGDAVTLFDEAGNEYRPEPDRNSIFIRPELNILFSEYSLIRPGESKEGRANVEVLAEASGFTAFLGDTDPTTSEGEYVDLGL